MNSPQKQMASENRKPCRSKTLAQKIAEAIGQELAVSDAIEVPSLRELARRFEVSWVTICRAASILRAQGILTYSRGKRPNRKGAADRTKREPACSARINSAATLSGEIRRQIEKGELKSAQILPKVSYFAATHHVSSHTVLAALRQLMKEGMVSHLGKIYQVGPLPQKSKIRLTANHPVLLIACRDESSWRELLVSERTTNFCRFFSSEAHRFAVELQPVLYGRKNYAPELLTAGQDEISASVKQFGSRYMGALLLGGSGDIPDFRSWIIFFCSLKRPCAWFDRVGEQAIPARQRLFSIFRHSEEKAIALAVGYLQEIGHRVIGYLSPSDSPWERNRMSLIQVEAATRGMELVAYSLSDTCDSAEALRLKQDMISQFESLTYFRQQYEHICSHETQLRKRYPGLPKLQGNSTTSDRVFALACWSVSAAISNTDDDFEAIRAFRYAWMFARHLRHRELTAIITPNDHRARRYYYHLKGIGIKIPAELSLISFDNYPELQPLPISTIDFGFDHLGYCAFHHIAADIPLRKTSEGVVYSQPRIVHGGSLAAPRNGLLELRYRLK